jgi:uncharacterized membrane protein
MTRPPAEQMIELAQQRDAPPRPHARSSEHHWLLILAAAFGTLLLALLFTPGLPLQWKMYAVVHGVCAQEHNIFLAGMQFPICARNTGIYSSFLLTLLVLLALGRGRAGRVPPWPLLLVLVAFFLLLVLDGFNSLFVDLGLPHLYAPRNELRTLTGIGMGMFLAVCLLLVFNLSLRADVDGQQPVLARWRELVGVLVLNLLVLAAIYGNLELLYWPLAFLAFVGITSVLYIINVIVCSLILGYDNTITRLSQLARPATLALLPTLVLLGLLGGLRFWLESQGVLL